VKTCVEPGCRKLGTSLRCPICGQRTCRTEFCMDEHARRHINAVAGEDLTDEEYQEAMADPVNSEAEDRTLDRIYDQIQARRRAKQN